MGYIIYFMCVWVNTYRAITYSVFILYFKRDCQEKENMSKH